MGRVVRPEWMMAVVIVRAETEPKIPMHIAAEAAEWIARLHGPARTRQMERACLEWQSRSEAHRIAFERCTETWDEVRSLSSSGACNTPAASVASVGELLRKWTGGAR